MKRIAVLASVCASTEILVLSACGVGGGAQFFDTPLPPLPQLPTLSDPLVYPLSGTEVPDAVEFQFNPTLRTVDSIRVVSGTEASEEDVLLSGSIDATARGVCLRFGAEGVKVVAVRGTNHMGAQIEGRVVFAVRGLGASVKTCTPWSGGRTFDRSNPFWVPSRPGQPLPVVIDGSQDGPWSFAVEYEERVWPVEWMRYAALVVEENGANLLEDFRVPLQEIEKLCPRYAQSSRQEKRAFWSLFLASISFPESGFNPHARFMEPSPLSKWSEGLLQLSADDYVSHGDVCNFMSEPDRILSPRENIRCGVAILQNQILQRRTLWPGTFYYWSVLTTQKSEVVKAVFRENADKKLPACSR